MHSTGSETRSPVVSGQSEEKKTHTLMGQISFVNTLPVVLPLLRGAVKSDCRLIFGTPADLNHKLEKGELHLGAMSSFYFLEDGGFELFPGISISGAGRVGSVILFSQNDLKDLNGKLVNVPDCSATSIKLLQVLLREEYGAEPILRRQSDLVRGDNAAAVLLIGDEALKQGELCHAHVKVDLAQWWYQRYRLPFVFGVWGARRQWAQNNPELFKLTGDFLVQACKIGLTGMLGEVINEAALRTGLKQARLADYYLNELDYKLSEEHIQALELFSGLCRKHGLLAQP
jgi:chorismate dehydratase